MCVIKIKMITTPDCYGCKVMDNTINKVISNYPIDIKYLKIDKDSILKEEKNIYRITRYPTTIIFYKDRYVNKIIGSLNPTQLTQILDKIIN